MASNLTALRAAVSAVRQATAGELPIAIGGAACALADGLRERLRVEICASNARSLVETARRLLGLDPCSS
jgi:hypothetical protein